MNSEVSQLLAALRNGTMSTEEVSQRFRERTWPRKQAIHPRTPLEVAAAAQEDPDQLIPGSFDEVAAAYYRGEISRQIYRLLAEAAAESMRNDDLHRDQTE